MAVLSWGRGGGGGGAVRPIRPPEGVVGGGGEAPRDGPLEKVFEGRMPALVPLMPYPERTPRESCRRRAMFSQLRSFLDLVFMWWARIRPQHE